MKEGETISCSSKGNPNVSHFLHRKLVSAKPDLGGEECVKTYLNVMASALGDEGSTICCPGGNAVLCSQNVSA